MSESYSPLRYPGGKAKLSQFIIEVIKENGLTGSHYIEPYAGGAGAALRLLFEEYVELVTINDADPRIRCFWQAAIRHSDRFLSKLNSVPVTVEEWCRQRAIYERRDLRAVFDLGFATFFLNRTTRSGILHNGGPIGGYDQSGPYKIDARFNRLAIENRLSRLVAYADRIEISDMDGLALLKKINHRRRSAPTTFVYIDPPYYSKGDELYMNRLSHNEHADLASYLKIKKRFLWLMTYDDVPQVRDLYSGMPHLPFSLTYSANNHRRGKELIIYPETLSVSHKALTALP